MTLSEIFEQAGQIWMKSPATEADRQFLLFYINFSAREFWNAMDLQESIREQTFETDASNYIALPQYIGRLRAIRSHCDVAGIRSQQARYQTGDWARNRCHQFTLVNTSALKRASSRLDQLMLQLVGIDTVECTVTITGPTGNAARDTVSIQMLPGDHEKTVATNLTDITSIVKSRVTAGNLVVLDALGEEIADIPNNLTESRYINVQVGGCYGDHACGAGVGQKFDVLYKVPFEKLANDTDIFPIAGYEEMFFYKMLEVRKLTDPDEADLMTIIQKEHALRQVNDFDHHQGLERRVDRGTNPFARLRNIRTRRQDTSRYIAGEDNLQR